MVESLRGFQDQRTASGVDEMASVAGSSRFGGLTGLGSEGALVADAKIADSRVGGGNASSDPSAFKGVELAPGGVRLTGQTTVAVTGRLQLDARAYQPPSFTGAKDFFGQPLRADAKYYRLSSPLSVKPLREIYIGMKTPWEIGAGFWGKTKPETIGSSIEIRIEPNATTKSSIPEGAILPAWFIETFNARFEDLPVGVRGISPHADGTLGDSPTGIDRWLHQLSLAHPGNIETMIGTGNPFIPGVQRLSSVPSKSPQSDAIAFDVRFGHLESAIKGAPDKLLMPDIYGTLYPADLNTSKMRVRTGLTVNILRTGSVEIGPVSLKLPSANAELIGQLLTSGNSPSKLVASRQMSEMAVTIEGSDRYVQVPRWVEAWLDKALTQGVVASGAATPPSQIALPLGGKKSLTDFLTSYERSLPINAKQLQQAVASFRSEVLAKLKDGAPVDGGALDRLIDLLVQMASMQSLPPQDAGLPPGAMP